ncbi:MAG: YabP/YqfC family sporulation protein [Lachnospiraceae bacterium]|nr:YabP/YqfC family sporulation protein [Lachnospiraceae bacterium]
MGYQRSTGRTGKETLSHKVIISGRNQGMVTGVQDVTEFDNNIIDLDTSLGRLLIKGRDLKVKGLNLEKGEVEIEGSMDSLVYTTKQSTEPLLKRLFK